MLGDSYLMIGQTQEKRDDMEGPQLRSGKRLNGWLVFRRRVNRVIDLFVVDRVQRPAMKRNP